MAKDYAFQAEDVAKLKDRRGRLNASEMGTGKTYMGAELDLDTDTFGPTLVVSPSGNFDNWRGRFEERNVPFFEVDPKRRSDSFRKFLSVKVPQGHKVFAVHWAALRLMPELVALSRETPWGHIIADEAHRLQGRKSQQTRALKAIKANFKTALSGTPLTNNPANYWSVLHWLYPDMFRGYWKFYEEYTDYEIIYPQGFHKIIGAKNTNQLLKLVDPFYVRHLKRQQCCKHHPQGVMPWLPEKYYTTKTVELSSYQRRAYNEMRDTMIAWVGSMGDQPVPAPVVVAQMMRLQQLAMAYAQVDEGGKMHLSEPSSKLDAVMEILEELQGAPLVVFSQFSQPLFLLEERLKKAGISYGLYTGSNRDTRDDVRRAFARGDIRVFAGTIQSGGEALDGLQNTCSTVAFLDRTWSPGSNQQAEDRLDRDGQTKPVQVIDIMARDTVDLGRRQRLETKWNWIRQLLGDPGTVQRTAIRDDPNQQLVTLIKGEK